MGFRKRHCPVVASQEEENKEKAFEALLPYSRQHLWFCASEGLEVPVHLCPHTSAGQVILLPSAFMGFLFP